MLIENVRRDPQRKRRPYSLDDFQPQQVPSRGRVSLAGVRGRCRDGGLRGVTKSDGPRRWVEAAGAAAPPQRWVRTPVTSNSVAVADRERAGDLIDRVVHPPYSGRVPRDDAVDHALELRQRPALLEEEHVVDRRRLQARSIGLPRSVSVPAAPQSASTPIWDAAAGCASAPIVASATGTMKAIVRRWMATTRPPLCAPAYGRGPQGRGRRGSLACATCRERQHRKADLCSSADTVRPPLLPGPWQGRTPPPLPMAGGWRRRPRRGSRPPRRQPAAGAALPGPQIVMARSWSKRYPRY